MVMPKNLVRHELIGLTVEIVDAKNANLNGLQGKIIDETKNLLIIETKNSTKKIIKNQVKMKIKGTIIKGEELVGRPGEKIKK